MAFFFVALLCLPYLLALPLVGGPWSFDLGEFIWALKNSLLQALGSGIIATLMGFLGALALTSGGDLLRLLFLLPGILPTLFLIISLLALTPQFPMGLTGIIIAHSIVSFGVVAVSLAQTLREQLGRHAEVDFLS
jgi:ABC-type spermidine/putrescine transport system permease subunit II